MDKELVERRKMGLDADVTNKQWDKLQGECEPGCRITIYWKQDEVSKEHGWDPITDKGYIFVLPGMDAKSADCYFHIPEPDNSGGKGEAPEEFGYLIDLLVNPLVDMISCEP